MTHPLDAASHLRARWKASEPTFGAWVYIPDSFSSEIIARADFDWACIDTQHGMARPAHLVPLLQALAFSGRPAVVRVPANDPGVVMNALDAGAAGIIVPMVNSAAEAAQAVASCRYPPLGRRSWGPARAAFGTQDYSAVWANERVLCVVMVETPEGVDNVDAILDVPGVDAVFVGPADLALSFGVERDDPRNADRIETVKKACNRRGTPVGIATASVDEAKHAARAGFAMIAVPSDAVLLAQACNAFLGAVRGV
jgi:4-hydroxy-2-oxoheptanedioate aldolase